MDIRNFFAKKKPTAGGATAPNSTTRKGSKTTVAQSKDKSPASQHKDKVAAAPTQRKPSSKATSSASNAGQSSSSAAPKKPPARSTKRLKIIDSDDDDVEVRSPLKAPAAATTTDATSNSSATSTTKRKAAVETSSPSSKKAKENVEQAEGPHADTITSTPGKDAKKAKDPPVSDATLNEQTSKSLPTDNQRRSSPRKPAPAATTTTTTTKTASSTKKAPLKKQPVAVYKPEPITLPIQGQDSFDANNASPMCLNGTTFCFTGVMADMPSRDEAVEMVKILGGRVTSNVSSKTNYLILGEVLEDGRSTESGSKYKRAVTEPNVTLIHGASQFFGLLQQHSDRQSSTGSSTQSTKPVASAKAAPTVTTAAAAAAAKSDPTPAATGSINPYAKAARNPYAKKTTSSAAPLAGANPYTSTSRSSSGAAHADSDDRKMPARPTKTLSKSVGTNSNTNQLWVDKYKPTQSAEILGNQDAVRKLSSWLASWEDKFVVGGSAKAKSFTSPNGPWKAALLSGPPGIGKTTTATLVANEAGRDVIEFNASDVRSKKAIKEEMGDITGSCTLEFRAQNSKGRSMASRQKRCIIMDEVDGMGAGDRSGMSELIQMIKSSRVPIICICNDRQSQKMKSLLPYCMDLRYRRPVKSVIANRAVQVAKLEGLVVEQNAAEAIVESCGNDVRQVLNCLQMWSSNTNNDAMTYKSLKERERSINKDEILRVSLFDAARIVVEGRKGLIGADRAAERTHFFHRNDAYYVDYNFVGLLVQQNYLKILQPQFNEVKRQNDSMKLVDVLDRVHDAAHSMSDWAVLDGSLHQGMNWSLLPATAALAVKTGYHAGGESGGVLGGFPEFTTWLGRNSSRNKKVRLMSELNHHMNYKISAGTSEMRMTYIPLIRDVFVSLLTTDREGNVEQAIELMDEYGLDRDDVFEKLDEFNMDSKASEFQKLDSKKKAAFTRLYNQGSHKSQALVAEQGGVKKLKRKASSAAELGDPDAINDDVDEEDDGVDDEDDDELDAEKIKALFKTKGRSKAATARKKAPEGSKDATLKSKPKAKAPRKR